MSFMDINFIAGLVPCVDDCTLCDLVALVNNIMDKAVLYLAAPAAAVFLAVYAFKLIISKGSPEAVADAKKKITNVIIGFIIILGAWLLIDYIVQAVVNQEVFPDAVAPWNKIDCSK